MKKSISIILIIFISSLSIFLTSCDKEEITTGEPSGTYKLVMDSDVIFEGKTTEVGMYLNNISLSEGEEFSILIANVPESVGSSVQISSDDDESGLVTITGTNLLLDDGSDELYFSISGTIKRESDSKISFSGTCSQLMGTKSHTFSGTVESDVFKII